MLNFDSLTSLDSLKDFLKIDPGDSDAQRDRLLQLAIVAATREIEGRLGRKFKLRKVTEYLDGTGVNALFLSRYPVRSVAEVYDDLSRVFGSDTLIDPSNYVVDSEQGMIRLFKDVGGFSRGRRNVKVVYEGGYGFEVVAGENDKIDFDEGSGELNATLAEGHYSIKDFASHVAEQMSAVGSGTYSVKYSVVTGKFTISVDSGTFSLLCSSGDNWDSTAFPLLGFDVEDDKSAASSHTSEHPVFGIPEDVVLAANIVAAQVYNLTMHGDNRLGRESRSFSGAGTGGTERWDNSLFNEQVQELLSHYERLYVG